MSRFSRGGYGWVSNNTAVANIQQPTSPPLTRGGTLLPLVGAKLYKLDIYATIKCDGYLLMIKLVNTVGLVPIIIPSDYMSKFMNHKITLLTLPNRDIKNFN